MLLWPTHLSVNGSYGSDGTSNHRPASFWSHDQLLANHRTLHSPASSDWSKTRGMTQAGPIRASPECSATMIMRERGALLWRVDHEGLAEMILPEERQS